MATRAQQIRLGIFFLVSLSVLALFFIVVAGSHLLHQRDTYYIESNSPVSGLNKGADVKYLGFSIGRVEDIAIAQDNLATVIVEISVERRLAENAIRTDTQARMASLGLTGLKYIELFGGSDDAPVLPRIPLLLRTRPFLVVCRSAPKYSVPRLNKPSTT